MRTLLFEHTERVQSEAGSIYNDLPTLNKLNHFFNELGVHMTKEMVIKVLSNPDKLIREIILLKVPATDPHTRLPINKDKILEGMELPRIDDELIRRLDIILNKDRLSLFDYGGNEVTVNEERLDKYMDHNRLYATDIETVEVFKMLNEVAEKLNKLNEKVEFMPLTDHSFGSSEYFFKGLIDTFSIRPDGLYLSTAGMHKVLFLMKRKSFKKG